MVSPYRPPSPGAQAVAEAAGFKFEVPATTLGVIGSYTPSAPALSGFGRFALYASACIQEALTKHPHIDALYARYGDPLTTLVNGICEAELDGDTILLALKSTSLTALIDDILAASQRDPDQMRRLQFACHLHDYIADAFIAAGAELRTASQYAACIKAFDHAHHHHEVALTFLDAMRKLNETIIPQTTAVGT